MNLQTMTIIFIVIFLPLLLVSTYYIQGEVDTISKQTSYDTKLIDATTDAMSAFEINTSNEDLSAVSDSLRSIIEASNNVFVNTLATNLGMSNANKSKLLPYIPAVVYTLYDGYYIYSPTQEPKVVTNNDGVYVTVGDEGVTKSGSGYEYTRGGNTQLTAQDSSAGSDYGKILYYHKDYEKNRKAMTGNTIKCTTNPDEAYNTTSYILKSFIPYAATYKNGNNTITINYTLDNYITITGNIGDTYYTKSGYLIDPSKLKSVKINLERVYYSESGKIIENKNGYPKEINKTTLEKYTLDQIDDLISENKNLTQNNEDIVATHAEIEYDGIKIEFTRSFSDGKWSLMTNESAYSEDYTGDKMVSDNESAIKYYLKAYLFSNWVMNNFAEGKVCQLKEKDIFYQEGFDDGVFSIIQNGDNVSENQNLYYTYNKDDKNFIFAKNDNIENKESKFQNHKRKVIQNSIQYNLNLAMKIYNKGKGTEEYQMPVISEPEWDKLLSNISILSFLEGLPCGFKTYNNYALVTSRNNEIMANTEGIYYVPIDGTYRKSRLDMYGNIEAASKAYITIGKGLLTSEMLEPFKNPDGTLADSIRDVVLPTAHHLESEEFINTNEFKNAKFFESFASREVKYDKVWSVDSGRSYIYDHVCNLCYHCILDNNYQKNFYGWYKSLTSRNPDEYGYLDRQELNKYSNNVENIKNNSSFNKLKQAEMIAVAKIRNNTYKTCSLVTNYGIKTVFPDIPFNVLGGKDKSYSVNLSNLGLNATSDIPNICEIDVVLQDCQEAVKNYTGSNRITCYNDGNECKIEKSYSCLSSEVQTVVFKDLNIYNNNNFKLSIDERHDVGLGYEQPYMKIKIISITVKYK